MKKLKFTFDHSKAGDVLPVTGYWVYETPRGLVMDLFYEPPRRTLSVTHDVADDGKLGRESDRDVEEQVVRKVLATVELTPQLALQMGKYLVETAQKQSQAAQGQPAQPGTSGNLH